MGLIVFVGLCKRSCKFFIGVLGLLRLAVWKTSLTHKSSRTEGSQSRLFELGTNPKP